jgi:hypothetical protein
MATISLPTRTIAPGVRIRKNKYDAYVGVGRKRVHKYFRLDTPLAKVQKWQRQTRASLLSERLVLEPQPIPVLPVAPDGWCYLYVFQAGQYIKIGRSVDPHLRLQQIQARTRNSSSTLSPFRFMQPSRTSSTPTSLRSKRPVSGMYRTTS